VDAQLCLERPIWPRPVVGTTVSVVFSFLFLF